MADQIETRDLHESMDNLYSEVIFEINNSNEQDADATKIPPLYQHIKESPEIASSIKESIKKYAEDHGIEQISENLLANIDDALQDNHLDTLQVLLEFSPIRGKRGTLSLRNEVKRAGYLKEVNSLSISISTQGVAVIERKRGTYKQLSFRIELSGNVVGENGTLIIENLVKDLIINLDSEKVVLETPTGQGECFSFIKIERKKGNGAIYTKGGRRSHTKGSGLPEA